MQDTITPSLTWQQRVAQLEDEGHTTSDAQAGADAEQCPSCGLIHEAACPDCAAYGTHGGACRPGSAEATPVEEAWLVENCYDVEHERCHECDQPLGERRLPVVAKWHDEDGWHTGTCFVHEGCTAQRAPEPEQQHWTERALMHEWAPTSASEQECIACGATRAIPEECVDHETVEECYALGHGGGDCRGADAESMAARAMREVQADIDAGVVPAAVSTFSALHDYTDANEYGGLTEEPMPDVDVANEVQERVHQWLAAGRPEPR